MTVRKDREDSEQGCVNLPAAIELDMDAEDADADEAEDALEADMELDDILPLALIVVLAEVALVPEEVPVLLPIAPEEDAQVAVCGTSIPRL